MESVSPKNKWWQCVSPFTEPLMLSHFFLDQNCFQRQCLVEWQLSIHYTCILIEEAESLPPSQSVSSVVINFQDLCVGCQCLHGLSSTTRMGSITWRLYSGGAIWGMHGVMRVHIHRRLLVRCLFSYPNPLHISPCNSLTQQHILEQVSAYFNGLLDARVFLLQT